MKFGELEVDIDHIIIHRRYKFFILKCGDIIQSKIISYFPVGEISELELSRGCVGF
ncbi:hypothetical protein SDC9_152509 [bioreactor metagenome]|uniref:Uncharacterized protein n=1 Tax=bioreactor metagenome TaxID=1076179 RepID=A0A645EVM4_9ZZZZ